MQKYDYFEHVIIIWKINCKGNFFLFLLIKYFMNTSINLNKVKRRAPNRHSLLIF